MGVHGKIRFLEGVYEKPIYKGNSLKKGVWTVSRFKGELGEIEGSVFEEEVWYPNAHYALTMSVLDVL